MKIGIFCASLSIIGSIITFCIFYFENKFKIFKILQSTTNIYHSFKNRKNLLQSNNSLNLNENNNNNNTNELSFEETDNVIKEEEEEDNDGDNDNEINYFNTSDNDENDNKKFKHFTIPFTNDGFYNSDNSDDSTNYVTSIYHENDIELDNDYYDEIEVGDLKISLTSSNEINSNETNMNEINRNEINRNEMNKNVKERKRIKKKRNENKNKINNLKRQFVRRVMISLSISDFLISLFFIFYFTIKFYIDEWKPSLTQDDPSNLLILYRFITNVMYNLIMVSAVWSANIAISIYLTSNTSEWKDVNKDLKHIEKLNSALIEKRKFLYYTYKLKAWILNYKYDLVMHIFTWGIALINFSIFFSFRASTINNENWNTKENELHATVLTSFAGAFYIYNVIFSLLPFIINLLIIISIWKQMIKLFISIRKLKNRFTENEKLSKQNIYSSLRISLFLLPFALWGTIHIIHSIFSFFIYILASDNETCIKCTKYYIYFYSLIYQIIVPLQAFFNCLMFCIVIPQVRYLILKFLSSIFNCCCCCCCYCCLSNCKKLKSQYHSITTTTTTTTNSNKKIKSKIVNENENENNLIGEDIDYVNLEKY
jgi:hypothetical protein